MVSKAVRLGDTRTNKPCLLQKEIGDLARKREVLEMQLNFVLVRVGAIYVSPDLTPKEHEQSKKLCEELRA